MRIPAEWEPQRAIWVGWPSDPALWGKDLPAAQTEVAALIHALTAEVPGLPAPAAVRVMAEGEMAVGAAKKATASLTNVTVIAHEMGDIWLRDTGPVFGQADEGGLVALRFPFNGWGGKDFGGTYDVRKERNIASTIAAYEGARLLDRSLVTEGGALEFDGAGTVMTTEVCLLNPNRHPEAEPEHIWQQLRLETASRHVWGLPEGLAFDHTDGHIDNAARFVEPGHVVTMEATQANDPQADALRKIRQALESLHAPSKTAIRLSTIPAPGLVSAQEDDPPLPASYLNYVISNGRLIMPLYGTLHDAAALEGLRALFPSHRVIGLCANTLLTGGGSFHCITQQVPA